MIEKIAIKKRFLIKKIMFELNQQGIQSFMQKYSSFFRECTLTLNKLKIAFNLAVF